MGNRIQQYSGMAATTNMTTSRAFRMSAGTSVATVSFTVLHDGITQIHNA
jgi:hypothetical protein